MFWKKKTEPIQVESPMLIAFRVEDRSGTLNVHLDPAQLGNPAEAGVMLADIGRHMAQALADTSFDGDAAAAFSQISEIFNAEARDPTQPLPSRPAQ